MSIMKLFFSHLPDEDREPDNDPLQHPLLATMSLEELADLPLMPENLGRPVENQQAHSKQCA